MPSRRPTLPAAALLACLALLAAALGATGPALAQPSGTHIAQGSGPAPATRSFPVEVVDGPAGEQRVNIDGDLLVPPGATAAAPAPAVVVGHGFGGDKDSEDRTAGLLTGAGYVVYAYSARGFGTSTGAIGLDGVDYDVVDARRVLDALAEVPEVALDGTGDPRVGIVGPSYGGGLALQVASVDDRVDAIVPLIAWHSLVSSLTPNLLGTDLRLQEDRPPGVLKQQWTSLFLRQGAAEGCAGFVPGVCEAYQATVDAGRPTPETVALLRDSSPATRIDGLDVPTLLMQGLADTLFTVNEAAANAAAIAANGAEVRMLWHSGGHGYPYAPGERAHLDAEMLRFLARHLLGDGTRPAGPFAYDRSWVEGDAAARSAEAGALPEPGEGVDLPLSADGTLLLGDGEGEVAARGSAGSVPFAADPARQSYSETSALQASPPFSEIPATDPPGSAAVFDTPPLAEPVEAVGIPALRTRVTSSTGEAVLFAKLSDVAPDGTATLIHRQVAPVRATDLAATGGLVELQLVGLAHRFEAGHRIRLTVASTDAAYLGPSAPVDYTLEVDPAESALTLPAARLPAPQAAVAQGAPAPAPAGLAAPDPDAPAVPPAVPVAAGLAAAAAALLALTRHRSAQR